MIQKVLVIIGLYMCCTLFSSQEPASSERPVDRACLKIINQTNWPASVYWKAQNKEYNTIVDAHSSDTLGFVGDLEFLEVGTYGQVWGSIFPRHSFSMQELKRGDAGQDVHIVIEKQAWRCGWAFKICICPKSERCARTLPFDPWNAFPGVLRAQCLNRPVMPHHILNIDPSRLSQQAAINCYKRLLAFWNPEQFSHDHDGIAQKICAILRQAHLDLQRELIEDSRHIEQTVYETSSQV